MDICSVSAILMAAGTSARMGPGVDKLLLPYGDKTLLRRSMDLLLELPFHQIILVTTEVRLSALGGDVPPAVTVVINEKPQRGQSESLRLGVEAATGEGYLFCVADQPHLDRTSLEQLLERGNSESIVYPTVEGAPRSPALFAARFRGELLAQRGDTGGREVRHAHPEACVPLEAKDPAIFRDIDTPEGYALLLGEGKID